MLNDRGITIPPHEQPLLSDEYTYANFLEDFKDDQSLNHMYGEECYVHYVPPSSKKSPASKSDVDEFLAIYNAEAIKYPQLAGILITNDKGITPVFNKSFDQSVNEMVQHFMYDELTLNPNEGFYSSPHRRLTDIPKELKDNFRYLPEMIIRNRHVDTRGSDAIAKWHGWKVNDVIAILRDGPMGSMTDQTIFYRRVVPSIIKAKKS